MRDTVASCVVDVAPDGRAHIGYTAVALGQLHHHYALKYIGEHIHTLCNFVNDFVCLRYAMPAACQLQRLRIQCKLCRT